MARPDGVFRSVVVVSDTGNGLVQIFTEESEPAGDASIPMPLGMHPAGYYAVVVASGRSDVFYTVDSRMRVTFSGPLEDLVDSSGVRSR